MRLLWSKEAGFTLLETVICVWLCALFLAAAVPLSIQFENRIALINTSQHLLWTLRDTQTFAVEHASTATVDLNPFQPAYFIYHGMTRISRQTFTPPVGYVDGYLQMPNHRIHYGASGSSDVMGVISLTDGTARSAITLYRGSGLQALTGDGAP